MQYDLKQELRDLNAELLILGLINKNHYFENEEVIDTFSDELFTVNMN